MMNEKINRKKNVSFELIFFLVLMLKIHHNIIHLDAATLYKKSSRDDDKEKEEEAKNTK